MGHPPCKDLEGFILIGVFGRHVSQHSLLLFNPMEGRCFQNACPAFKKVIVIFGGYLVGITYKRRYPPFKKIYKPHDKTSGHELYKNWALTQLHLGPYYDKTHNLRLDLSINFHKFLMDGAKGC